MWMCIDCGEGGIPDKHKCNPRILQAVAYGRDVERNSLKSKLSIASTPAPDAVITAAKEPTATPEGIK